MRRSMLKSQKAPLGSTSGVFVFFFVSGTQDSLREPLRGTLESENEPGAQNMNINLL